MHLQINNLIETNTNRVYNAIVADDGLYLLHITNTDGLHDYAGGSINRSVLQQQGTENYLDQMAEGTEEIAQQLTDEVWQNEHSRHFTFPQLQTVQFTPGNPPELRIASGDDHFTLRMENMPPERAQEFFTRVRELVDTERAGEYEQKRRR